MAFQNGCISIKIPKLGSDITKDWIEKATGLSLKEETSIVITSNIQDGIGFLSNLCRVSFQLESGSTESILVKLLPEVGENIDLALLAIDQKVDQREIQFYSNVRFQILEIAPELSENFCSYYCSKISEGENGEDYSSMLVFEDLKPLGYQMLDPDSSKWRQNLEELMKFCGKFHAAGIALKKRRNSKLSEMFPFCLGAEENEDFGVWFDLGENNFSRLDKILIKANCSEETVNAYRKLSGCWEEILRKSVLKARKFSVLAHADLWSCNIMVNEDDAKAPMKIIDWQTLSIRDPTYDMSLAILFCILTKELSKKNVDYFAKLYYKEFLAACEKYGCKFTGRTEEEFMEFFDTWGMGFGYCWFLFSVDIFEGKPEKMVKVLEFLQDQYGTADFLFKECYGWKAEI